jgi:FRG domain-containing protein
MPKVPEKTVESFKQYVALIERLLSRAKNSLWFRGCGKGSEGLIPSLYRHKTKKKKADIEELERNLMTRFRQRSIPLVNRPLSEDWETLFFMQHYGIPTRLLDWTENPFIAFYFAVMSGKFSVTRPRGEDTAKLKFSNEATIWVLDPIVWTNHALKQQSYTGGVLTPLDSPLSRYKPLTKFDDMHIHPVALYGAHNSPRIVAQRGVFTIFGQGITSMEKVYDKDKFPRRSLMRLILPKDALPIMRNSILSHGITESVVFPDLEGLAKEMKREFGFGY